MGTPPFARNAVGTVRAGRLVVGTQEAYEIREYGACGGLLRLLRIPGNVRSVGAEELELFIQGRQAAAPGEAHARIREDVSNSPRPETLPAFGSLLADGLGNLWVGEWAMHPEVPGFWRVFDASCGWLGEVAMPPRFTPMDVGQDWILGLETDELDVEYLVLLPLSRG